MKTEFTQLNLHGPRKGRNENNEKKEKCVYFD